MSLEIHNLTIEPEARLVQLRTVPITPEIVELLGRSLRGDAVPLVEHLSSLVDYDPALLVVYFHKLPTGAFLFTSKTLTLMIIANLQKIRFIESGEV